PLACTRAKSGRAYEAFHRRRARMELRARCCIEWKDSDAGPLFARPRGRRRYLARLRERAPTTAAAPFRSAVRSRRAGSTRLAGIPAGEWVGKRVAWPLWPARSAELRSRARHVAKVRWETARGPPEDSPAQASGSRERMARST